MAEDTQVVQQRRIQRQLPGNGETVWVDVDDDYQPEMKPMNVQARQVAGQNGCQHCGIVFNSAATLDNHIKISHVVATGGTDMRAVPMPDGSVVPASQVPELLASAKETKAEAVEVLEENEKLKIELAEQKKKIDDLEAFATEKIAESLTPSRPVGRPRKR